jgi:endo-1,4-beta-D-glucanase Y
MKKTVIAGIVCISALSLLYGQARPFPQAPTYKYPYGYTSTRITSAYADSIYGLWKTNFLSRDCSGQLRVLSDVSGVSKSEGMGYGLILTAYYGEKNLYDSLLTFYKSKLCASADSEMGWEATCTGWQSQSSATDGDIDAAYSCIVAYCQWGGTYLQTANTFLKRLAKNLIVICGNNIPVVGPGITNNADYGGATCTDVSYYTPAYFRIFAQATGNTLWTTLADSTLRVRNACTNATTGLLPGAQEYNGTPSSCIAEATYGYDACRVPWRTAIDYLWNGDTVACNWCVKVTNWANGKGPKNIVDGYDLNGTATGTNHNSAFVGGFAVGNMCNSQTMVDSFGAVMKTFTAASGDLQYFNLSLKAMYTLVLSGNLWQPNLSTAVVPGMQEPGRMAGVRLLLNGNKLTLAGASGIRSASIVTAAGRVVASAGASGERNAVIDVSALGKGLYIVNIAMADGKKGMMKFVK